MDVIDKLYIFLKFEKVVLKKWVDKKIFSKYDLIKKFFLLFLLFLNVIGVFYIGYVLD